MQSTENNEQKCTPGGELKANLKMADEFKLPLQWDADIPAEEVKVFDCRGEKAVYAVHAVNRHDDLVRQLELCRHQLQHMCNSIKKMPICNEYLYDAVDKAEEYMRGDQHDE